MPRSVTQLPQADDDLLEIVLYLDGTSESLGNRFTASAIEAFEELARMPYLGTPVNSRNPRLSDLRYRLVPRFRKYAIFFRTTEEEVVILRVLHGARNFAPLLELSDEDLQNP